jgi:hypothetical protein
VMKVNKYGVSGLSPFVLSHRNQNKRALGRIHFLGVRLYHRARCCKPGHKKELGS